MKVLVVDDHPLLRQSLAKGLLAVHGITRVLESASGKEGLKSVLDHQPEIVVLDVHLGDSNGSQLVPALLLANPSMKIILLTGNPQEIEASAVASPNVVAVLDKKDADVDRIQSIIVEALNLQSVQAGRLILDGQADSAEEIAATLHHLNNGLRKVFVELGTGLTTKEIALKLALSTHTVESYRKELAAAFGVSGSALVRKAVVYCLWMRECG
jgi:DNA-binding NarL/FixJ family response regulator